MGCVVKKMKRNNIKLRINPKNIETRVGTLASPEAFDPGNLLKRKYRKKMEKVGKLLSRISQNEKE